MEQVEVETSVSYLLDAILASDDAHEIPQILADQVNRLLDGDITTVYKYDTKNDLFIHPPYQNGGSTLSRPLTGILRKSTVPYGIIKSGIYDPIFIADTSDEESQTLLKPEAEEDKQALSFVQRESIKSTIVLPLVRKSPGQSEGEPQWIYIGLVFVNYREQVPGFTEVQKKLAGVLSRIAAIGIEKAHLLLSAQTLSNLADVSKITASWTKEDLGKAIIDEIRKILTFDFASLWDIEWLENKLKAFAVSTPDETDLAIWVRDINEENSPLATAFRKNETDLIEDFRDDERRERNIAKHPEAKEILEQVVAMIVVPLSIEDRPIGMLALHRFKTENRPNPSPFTRGDEQRLKALASHAAIALYRIKLEELLTEKTADLLKVSHDENAEPSSYIQALNLAIVRKAMELTGADDGRLRLLDHTGHRLVPGAVRWSKQPSTELTALAPEVCVRMIATEVPSGQAAKTGEIVREPALILNASFQAFVADCKQERSRYERDREILRLLLKKRRFKSLIDALKATKDQGLSPERFKALTNWNYGTANAETIKDKIMTHLQAIEKRISGWTYYEEKLDSYRSEIAVPIIAREVEGEVGEERVERVLGVLNVHTHADNPFILTNADKALLGALASRATEVLLEHEYDLLRNFQEFEELITACFDIKELAGLIVRSVKGVALFDKTEVYPLLYVGYLPPKDRPMEDPRTIVPFSPKTSLMEDFSQHFQHVQRTMPVDPKDLDGFLVENSLGEIEVRAEGLGLQAIERVGKGEKNIIEVISDVQDPACGGHEKAREQGIKTTACIPLEYNNLIYGLLYIHSKQFHYYTQQEKDALALFANQAAISLRNISDFGGQSYEQQFGREWMQFLGRVGGR